MKIPPAPSYKRYRFPTEMISHAVWRYVRFSLRYRDAETLLAVRGMTVTYATLHHRRAQTGDTWHLDAVLLTINGKQSYLWRAVDQSGTLLDSLVHHRRSTAAAKTCFRKLLKDVTTFPRVIRTDTLARAGAAHEAALAHVKHRSHTRRNH